MEAIAKRLKRLRLNKGLSLKQVAEELQISPSTYRDWEYGKAIQGEPYVALAEVMGVSLMELMTGKINQHQDLLEGLQRLEENVKSMRNIVLTME
jgi:transcriptional regulator with XRE-family HTH domain